MRGGMEHRDYYRVLGVAPTADRKEIKEAYRRLAMKHHPDRNRNNPDSALKMKRVNEAYAVLADPEKKREYDSLKQQYGSSAHSRFKKTWSENDIFSGPDMHRIFEEMAKAFGVREYKQIFREFHDRASRRFEFKKPGFFSDGFVFSSGPRGKSARPDGEPLFIDNVGKLPEWFLKNVIGFEIPVEGDDIHDTIKLAPLQAIQGGSFTYHLRKRARKLVVKAPPGIREGQKIRLAGMGEPGKGGGKAGDLYLKVRIKAPLLSKVKDFVTSLVDKAKT